jgi:thioesterase domain-containing protein
VVKVGRLLQCDLPVAAAFEHPTIAGFAQRVREARRDRHAREAPPWTPLVALRATGWKPPMFFAHPAGGGISCYLDLARAFDPERPCYGLQARELERAGAEGEAYASLEDMVAHYVAAIRGVQASGPYYLGGWSFGGVIAFEMAVQLQQAGAEVGLLALLDTYPPILARDRRFDDGTLLFGLARERAVQSGHPFSVTFEEVQACPAAGRFAFVVRRLQEERFIGTELTDARIATYLRGFRTREDYLRLYTPRVYDGPITLFNAAEVDPETAKVWASRQLDVSAPARGWDRLSTRPVDVHVVPGSHMTIAIEPNVGALATQLHACLAAADMTSSVAAAPARGRS